MYSLVHVGMSLVVNQSTSQPDIRKRPEAEKHWATCPNQEYSDSVMRPASLREKMHYMPFNIMNNRRGRDNLG